MKKIHILMVLLLCFSAFQKAEALTATDTIVKLEYFVDVDPGFGLATDIPLSQDTLIEIDFTALLTGASPGIHFIGIRAMNGASQWGQTHIFRFIKDNKTTVDILPDLSQAEYFVDTDYGYGSGTPITTTEDSIVQLNPVINLSTASEGFHILGIRAKDGATWGQTHLFRFMLDNKTTVDLLPNITEVEYFVDTDTGYSQCAAITTSPDSMIILNPAMTLTSLQPGYHILGIRAKDAKTWGQTHLFRFILDNKTTIDLLPDLSKVEYFIDTDPGFDNSTALSISPDSSIHITPTISMNGLTPGIHILGIRSKDQQCWGQTHLYRFVNNDEPPTLHHLSYIEYFIDTEPGFGNATKIYPAQDSMWDTTYVADLSALALGSYFMGVRAMDTMNKFSHTYIHPFNVVEPPFAYNFTGGGSLCAGSSGLTATLLDSDTGISYVLYKDGNPYDTLPGTDTNLVWTGLTGGVYTVVGYYTPTPHIFAPMNGTVTITEYPLPTLVCPADIDVCINVDSLALSGAIPSGGTYSGTYVSNNHFFPPQAGIGSHAVTYTYTDANTCTNTCTFNINVNTLPTVTCPTDFDICINADSIELIGALPTGGLFAGTGVGNNYFKPAQAGLGTHVITYTYTDINLCSNICTFNITVTDLPTVICPADMELCMDADSVLLTGVPAGGAFFGAGTNGNYFMPSISGTGIHAITYNYTGGSGCINSCQFSVTVNALPLVTCPADFAVCVNADSVLLSGGTPSGGSYSGTGISGDYFLPWIASAGNHIITYTYSDANGCSNSCTFNITVHDVPLLNCGPDIDVCIDADTFLLISGTLPPGGTYSGTGVNNNYFNPAQAGIGSHTITYTYTDANSCSATCSFDINVYGLPVIGITSNSPICQLETMSIEASGGITYFWQGPGTLTSTDSYFIIANADMPFAGDYTVFVSNEACTADTTVTFVINPRPSVLIVASANSVCEGSTVLLSAEGTSNITGYTWNTNANTKQITVTPTLPFSQYSVTVSTAYNCTSTDNIIIVTNPVPSVELTGTPESCIDKADGRIDVAITNPTVQPYSYLWYYDTNSIDSGVTDMTAFYLSNAASGDYILMLEDAFGCTASATYTLAPSTVSCNKGAMVPDIFSPNGDNNNDVLYVYGKNIKDVVFIIYSRWGNKIFESTDINDGWDGKYNGTEMPSGVYAYYLVVTYNDGSADVINGDVTLVR